jgi:hypothetical protein
MCHAKSCYKLVELPHKGALGRIDIHSLHSRGVCNLTRVGYSNRAIQKMGRWAPNLQSLNECIQQQLSMFSQGMSAAMSWVSRFTDMEGTGNSGNLHHIMVH